MDIYVAQVDVGAFRAHCAAACRHRDGGRVDDHLRGFDFVVIRRQDRRVNGRGLVYAGFQRNAGLDKRHLCRPAQCGGVPACPVSRIALRNARLHRDIGGAVIIFKPKNEADAGHARFKYPVSCAIENHRDAGGGYAAARLQRPFGAGKNQATPEHFRDARSGAPFRADRLSRHDGICRAGPRHGRWRKGDIRCPGEGKRLRGHE